MARDRQRSKRRRAQRNAARPNPRGTRDVEREIGLGSQDDAVDSPLGTTPLGALTIAGHELPALPRLAVRGVSPAPLAVLAQPDAIGIVALGLVCLVVPALALLAREGDGDPDVSAGHARALRQTKGRGMRRRAKENPAPGARSTGKDSVDDPTGEVCASTGRRAVMLQPAQGARDRRARLIYAEGIDARRRINGVGAGRGATEQPRDGDEREPPDCREREEHGPVVHSYVLFGTNPPVPHRPSRNWTLLRRNHFVAARGRGSSGRTGSSSAGFSRRSRATSSPRTDSRCRPSRASGSAPIP